MKINPEKKKVFNEYLDEILPETEDGQHPFFRFHIHEIVIHPLHGYGIVTAFQMPDFERDLEGLSIQFVNNGDMGEHLVFTASEVHDIETTGFIFDINEHVDMSLEDVVKLERGDAPLPGLR